MYMTGRQSRREQTVQTQEVHRVDAVTSSASDLLRDRIAPSSATNASATFEANEQKRS